MDSVNIFSSLRSTVRKDVPFLPGAWVEFWDSITIGEAKRARDLAKAPQLEATIGFILAQVANWNFTDGTNPLPITPATFDTFSMKLLTWFSQMEADIMQEQNETKKKLPDNLSNPSEPNTPQV